MKQFTNIKLLGTTIAQCNEEHTAKDRDHIIEILDKVLLPACKGQCRGVLLGGLMHLTAMLCEEVPEMYAVDECLHNHLNHRADRLETNGTATAGHRVPES